MDGCFQGSRAATRQGTGGPGLALSYRTLASFSRLILLDRRAPASSILSRPIRFYLGVLYQELALILDEVGSQRAALLATLDAGPMALFFAATDQQEPAYASWLTPRPSGWPTTTQSGCPPRLLRRSCGGSTSSGGLRRWPPRACRAGPATCDCAGGSPSHSSRAAGMMVGCQLPSERGGEALCALAWEPAESRMELLW
jgi:hypothetical protein